MSTFNMSFGKRTKSSSTEQKKNIHLGNNKAENTPAIKPKLYKCKDNQALPIPRNHHPVRPARTQSEIYLPTSTRTKSDMDLKHQPANQAPKQTEINLPKFSRAKTELDLKHKAVKQARRHSEIYLPKPSIAKADLDVNAQTVKKDGTQSELYPLKPSRAKSELDLNVGNKPTRYMSQLSLNLSKTLSSSRLSLNIGYKPRKNVSLNKSVSTVDQKGLFPFSFSLAKYLKGQSKSQEMQPDDDNGKSINKKSNPNLSRKTDMTEQKFYEKIEHLKRNQRLYKIHEVTKTLKDTQDFKIYEDIYACYEYLALKRSLTGQQEEGEKVDNLDENYEFIENLDDYELIDNFDDYEFIENFDYEIPSRA